MAVRNDVSRNAKGPFDFKGIKISLASPENIREWSEGEVTQAETINYRSHKPEPEGLFCEKIFGPVRDWECMCGKFKRVRNQGIVCDRCGVKVTHSRVRRERMGHIELAVPVVHIWYFKSRKISTILEITNSNLERTLYYESPIVIKSEHPDITPGTVLSTEEYYQAKEEYGDVFKVGMGAEAVMSIIRDINLDELAATLRTTITNETTASRRKKSIKRLKEVEAFRLSQDDNKPEWMFIKVLPVLPPDLRPLVPLDGGRFASSDLNDLYRRVINRNNRLKRLLDLQAPDVILRNEKRMLQEAVDAVLDNSSRRKPVKGAGMRPLRSLSDLLKGKKGRFRQNLLGKRVDYSGRSVIVVGPDLKLHQCGIPKMMALELFKPFVIARLHADSNMNITVREAQTKWEKSDPAVWPALEQVIQNHPVLLNRAPTLHRLGVQAFEPVLIEGKAIQLHPLACAAFNADFDGDQMAVHVPLSAEAQIEARVLMLGSSNILRPASGEPVATPSQDMVIGIYYLTKPFPGAKGEGMLFCSKSEVRAALDAGKVDLHAKIKVKGVNTLTEHNGDKVRKPAFWKDYTTVGQVIFNEIIPDELGYILANARVPHEKIFSKKGISVLVSRCFSEVGAVETAIMLDNLKDIGFHYATISGLTIGMDDMRIPSRKSELIKKAREQIRSIETRARNGELTEAERYNRVIDTWAKVTDAISVTMMEGLSHENHGFNPIFMMANSGARGSKDQMKQLAGMRGLMAKPTKKMGELGETIETPIISSLKEGLSVIEYSISTHGARKGLADTALKTADAGYLTRRLVDVCQDVIINSDDCGTVLGRVITVLKEGEKVIEPLMERILGRIAAETIYKPGSEEIVCTAGQEITPSLAALIDEIGVESVRIRSVLTCEAEQGLCAKCYGWDLSRNRMVTVGEAVGVIAAQSIGEPGTQLTLRTFHTGGVAGSGAKEADVIARHAGRISYRNYYNVSYKNENGDDITVSTRNTVVDILDEVGDVLSSYDIVVGSLMHMEDEKKIKKGDIICNSDPFIIPIVAEQSGSVHYVDIEEDVTLKEDFDSEQRKQMVIVEDKSKILHPHVFILPEEIVVLSGRSRRREEELHITSELIAEMKGGAGRMIFTYQHVSGVKTETLAEEFLIKAKKEKLLSEFVDCRRTGTGSYAAFMDVSHNIIKAFKGRAKVQTNALAIAADALENAKTRKNDTLEEQFIKALCELSKKGHFIIILDSLDLAHAGTQKLVKVLQSMLADSAILMMISFVSTGWRNHIQQKAGQIKEIDPVEAFIEKILKGKYPIPSGAHLRVNDGSIIKNGMHIARIERKIGHQKDITGGLPRVEELFEARNPKDAAGIAEINGVVAISPIKTGQRTITIRGDQGQSSSMKVSATKHIRVHEGDRVKAGDRLIEGSLSPHDILRVMGTETTERYLLNEVQEVYRLQGVKINDKHISIVVRQMLSKAKIDNPGDTRFLEGSQIDRRELQEENAEIIAEGGKPATSSVLLLGITKASLATSSFLSAASFQETNKVLGNAATLAKVDYLQGLKENVIVAHLIPAGSGMGEYQNVHLTMSDGSELPKKPVEKMDIDEGT